MWDVFAISTYLTISTTFLFIGLIPDVAVLRDAEKNPIRKRIFSALSLGWRNSEAEWRHFARAYLFLAAFSTPLVLSVHSVVSFDFAMALVARLAHDDLRAVLRRRRDLLGHGDGVHDHHPDPEVLQAAALRDAQRPRRAARSCASSRRWSSGCAYLIEFFIGWYGAVPVEQQYWWNRVFGQWWWAAWIMLMCNVILPLSLFSQNLRRNPSWLWILSLFINLGMWFERFVIIVPRLSHEFEPWQWSTYVPTFVDYCDPHRVVRLVLHVVPALHPAAPGDRDLRGEGDRAAAADARAQIASPFPMAITIVRHARWAHA